SAAGASAAADAPPAAGRRTGPARFGAWRNLPSQPQTRSYRAEPDGTPYEIAYRTGRTGTPAPETGERVLAARPDAVVLETGGVTRHFTVTAHGDRTYVDTASGAYTFTALPRFTDPADRTAPGSLLAPMPGTVVRLAVGLAPGAAVEAGQPLVWLEAMKMEHRILAPASGTLTALHAAPGLQVEVGTLLAVVQDAPPPAPAHQEETTP
ncbi:acetyl-CoA carboxylase biotin carboxyl carrier protein subunit, partial [Streptomyces sp. NPDC056796]|uniref:acetyl-CoA carboxylase biotin carboxyl carrier protein subunit n=1 Tax=Streptomyces sp. NPDC056796 TaxID=3345947 RepID=UPI00367BAF4A